LREGVRKDRKTDNKMRKRKKERYAETERER
jgi:hypothetical protein